MWWTLLAKSRWQQSLEEPEDRAWRSSSSSSSQLERRGSRRSSLETLALQKQLLYHGFARLQKQPLYHSFQTHWHGALARLCKQEEGLYNCPNPLLTIYMSGLINSFCQHVNAIVTSIGLSVIQWRSSAVILLTIPKPSPSLLSQRSCNDKAEADCQAYWWCLEYVKGRTRLMYIASPQSHIPKCSKFSGQ